MEEFDISRLSDREREILDLAIDGLTDQQIAHRISISVSTVNSYWVRIRGKVGFFSRTELATKCLRAKASAEMKVVEAERARYQHLAEQREQQGIAVKGAECYQAALEAMPEPVLVIDSTHKIVFANRLLSDLFGYEDCELVGRPIDVLMLPSYRAEHHELLTRFFQSPAPVRLGIDKVLYGRHRDGSRFRIMILMGSAETSEGKVATCIIRSFLSEIDTLRRRAATVMLS